MLAASRWPSGSGASRARSAGCPGARLAQDNAIWKPPSGKALLAHQDAAYLDWLDPPNMTTCWIALDDTTADGGTIYYVARLAPLAARAAGRQLPRARRLAGPRARGVPAGAELELVPIEVPAGGAAFHDGWTFHGSPANERADASGARSSAT